MFQLPSYQRRLRPVAPGWPRHPLSEWGTSESLVSPWSRPVSSFQASGHHPSRGDRLPSSGIPVGGLSERRSIRSSPGTWRAGLPSTTSAAGRSGIMLKKSSVGICPAGCFASGLRGRGAQAAAIAFWWRFLARAAASVRRVQVDGWPRRRHTRADNVITPVSRRPWVVSEPKRLRSILADRP